MAFCKAKQVYDPLYGLFLFYSNIVPLVGLFGPIMMVISRFIFASGGRTFWRGIALIPIIFGIIITIIIMLKLKESSKYEQMKNQPEFKSRSFINDIKSLFQTENRKFYMVLLLISF